MGKKNILCNDARSFGTSDSTVPISLEQMMRMWRVGLPRAQGVWAGARRGWVHALGVVMVCLPHTASIFMAMEACSTPLLGYKTPRVFWPVPIKT